MASELESDLRDNADWVRKRLVDFSAGKTQLVSFDQSSNTGAISVKMDGSILEEEPSFKMLGLTFSSKLEHLRNIVQIHCFQHLKINLFCLKRYLQLCIWVNFIVH